MSEEPNSIWRKPWQGWRGALLWFALLTVATFAVIFCIGLMVGPDRGLLIAASVSSVCIALLIVLGILFFRWVCCWGNFRRLLFGVACFATLVALFYAEENWRGKHAWKKFKTEWEAKGEQFDFARLAPPAVPDEQNFAMAPLWRDLFRFEWDPIAKRNKWIGGEASSRPVLNIWRTNAPPGDEPKPGNWMKAERAHLAEWQNYYRDRRSSGANRTPDLFPMTPEPQSPAADVLLALSRYDEQFRQLREACQRPGSRFAINYEDGFAALLPHLAKLKASSQFLSLHAEAELELGNTEAALEDIKIAFRLIEAIRTEPILISQLVRMAMLQILLNPVWQGLADHRWNEAQLLALDQEFRRMDFLADYQLAMRGERAMGMWAADFVRRTRDLNEIGDSSDEEAALAPRTPWFDSDLRAALVHLMPGGWFEQNKLSLCRGHEKWLLPLVDAQNRRISPSLVNHSVAEIKSRLRQSTPFNFLGRLSLPGLSKSSYRFALTQASVDLARVACALERYRLAHGQYPEAIDALAPPFIEELPHDLINGQPLKYRRTDPPATGSPSATANQFILYSVGWNETDDGGQIGLTEKGGVDSKKGDWVWQFTEK